jgi:hypothetical protein
MVKSANLRTSPARDEMVVKQKRAPGDQSAHPAPAVHQPPPPPYVVHQPTPPFPSSPRQHFKIYLIEAEAPSVSRAFIFTFLDPDDPTYAQMDDDTEGS